jgi:hypothetical protein
MPKLTKKEGLFLSRLQDQGGRIAISGNKYDPLTKDRAGLVAVDARGYQMPESDRERCYRIKHLTEPHERIATQSELRFCC